MINLREAQESDIPHLVTLGAEMHAESPRYREFPYSIEKVTRLFEALIRGDGGSVFLVEDRGDIFGMHMGFIDEMFFSERAYIAKGLVLYVTPSRRGGSAAVRLAKAFEQWGQGFGVVETQVGVTTGVDDAAYARFYTKLGYHDVGTLLSKAG